MATASRKRGQDSPPGGHSPGRVGSPSPDPKADNGWRQRLQSIAEAQDLTPKIPTTLKAELRDYQKEGFIWMSRLAHLGGGPVLPMTWAWARRSSRSP